MERAWALLERVAKSCVNLLGETLTGIYAHGSLAFGCFRWETSDIDFLVVTESLPSEHQKQRLLETLLTLDSEAPPKGFEMSVVLAEDCLQAVHPARFLLHFSNAHKARCCEDVAGYCRAMQGVDPDLIAHFAVTRAVGQAVCGRAIDKVFGPVAKADYMDSIRCDLACAEADVVEHPAYVILNLCRGLAYRQEELILSKEQGARWGLAHLPEEEQLIRAALATYTAGVPFQADEAASRAFAKRMKERLFQPQAEEGWQRRPLASR